MKTARLPLRRRLLLALAASAAAATAAAAADEVAATMAALHAQDVAVATVGYRLATGAAALCRPGGASGLLLQRLSLYGADFRPAARRLVGIGDRPTVAVAVAGSPAARAGLREGDAIVAIGAARFDAAPATGRDADFGRTDADRQALDKATAAGAATVDYLRGGAAMRTLLTPVRACPARFDVRAGRTLNAYSDGTTVLVAAGLAGFTQGDGELAAVIAHELAHNILAHPARLAGPRARGLTVKRTEIEADRLSVYLMVLAGYDPAAAVTFWTRFARARGLGLALDPQHPGWRERVRTIEAEAAAIRAAQARGEAVTPPPDLRAPAG